MEPRDTGFKLVVQFQPTIIEPITARTTIFNSHTMHDSSCILSPFIIAMYSLATSGCCGLFVLLIDLEWLVYHSVVIVVIELRVF